MVLGTLDEFFVGFNACEAVLKADAGEPSKLELDPQSLDCYLPTGIGLQVPGNAAEISTLQFSYLVKVDVIEFTNISHGYQQRAQHFRLQLSIEIKPMPPFDDFDHEQEYHGDASAGGENISEEMDEDGASDCEAEENTQLEEVEKQLHSGQRHSTVRFAV